MSFLLQLVFIFSAAASSEPVCEGYKPSKMYLDLKSQVEKSIAEFANKKPVAQMADDMLSKLISAKSPIVFSWLEKRDLMDRPEEEIAKEWRLYFAKNFILTKYPHSDAVLNKAIEQLVNGTIRKYATEPFKRRMEQHFRKAKGLAKKFIADVPITEKEAALKRIDQIKLY